MKIPLCVSYCHSLNASWGDGSEGLTWQVLVGAVGEFLELTFLVGMVWDFLVTAVGECFVGQVQDILAVSHRGLLVFLLAPRQHGALFVLFVPRGAADGCWREFSLISWPTSTANFLQNIHKYQDMAEA